LAFGKREADRRWLVDEPQVGADLGAAGARRCRRRHGEAGLQGGDALAAGIDEGERGVSKAAPAEGFRVRGLRAEHHRAVGHAPAEERRLPLRTIERAGAKRIVERETCGRRRRWHGADLVGKRALAAAHGGHGEECRRAVGPGKRRARRRYVRLRARRGDRRRWRGVNVVARCTGNGRPGQRGLRVCRRGAYRRRNRRRWRWWRAFWAWAAAS